MTVKIQGTIVSADYDDPYFASYIDKGVITPSSRIVAALETANEPVDLYVNSYGGDVFAGGEMMIALKKCAAAGNLGSVEVGSLAASMAANIVAALAAQGVAVTGHANSQLMFHGCYTTTEGGAQHHEDVAESLRNINESVIADLNRIGVSECRAWFAEGREKWMAADEAVKLGLFKTLADGDAPVADQAQKTASRLAAFASKLIGRKEYKMEVDSAITEEPKAEAPAAETAPKAEIQPVEAPKAEEQMIPLAECEKRLSGIQAAKDKQISDLTAKHSTEVKALEDKISSILADWDKDKEALADVRKQLDALQRSQETVVTAALAPAPEMVGNAREVLAKMPMGKRDAFYKAHRAEIDNK